MAVTLPKSGTIELLQHPSPQQLCTIKMGFEVMSALTVNLDPMIHLTDEQFFPLCQVNRDLRFERNANGDLIIMTPTGGESSSQNAELTVEIGLWNRQAQMGVVFDSSGGFKLPNGVDRSPDAAWIASHR